MVVVGKDHMRVFAEHGWSKEAIREYLWTKLSGLPGRYASDDRSEPLLLAGAESINLVAAEGFGFGSQLLTPHVGRVSTQVLRSTETAPHPVD
jgi:hypothetical protein